MKSILKQVKQSLRSESSNKRKEKERWFLENGGIFLKELIADCNGKSIPIRNFSPEQILKATNNFDSSCSVCDDAIFEWFKGNIEDKPYLIKRFHEDRFLEQEFQVGAAYNDIVVSARMSNHSNFLKLFGCCFEFSFPVFVFEYIEHGVLNQRGRIMVKGEETILPWSVRFKIGKETANALTYLHTAFPRITIHRDIKPTNIFLDENWIAKLSNFSTSITLPEGKSRIEMDSFEGTLGYINPIQFNKLLVSQCTDVYSFGISLLIVITGRPVVDYTISDVHIARYVKGLYENGKLDEVIDPMIAKEITSGERLQVEACVVLALRCCEEDEDTPDEDRPKMIQVAKELKRIERIQQSLDATSGLLKPEILEDGSSMVKWTKKFGIKIEIMLILSFCIAGCLMALLFG